MSGVLEEITFVAVPLLVSFHLFRGEYPPVDLLRDIKCLVDQMSNIVLQVSKQVLKAIISFWSISMMWSAIS